MKPELLRPSDPVSLVAPAGPFDRESFEVGLRVLSSRYSPRLGDSLFSAHRYLAGDDARRTSELLEAFRSPESRAVFCVRGGYGVMRLLPRIDLDGLPLKPLIGFSDITALHLALQSRGRVSFHAPVLTQLGRSGADVVERLWQLLERDVPAPSLLGTETYVEGAVEGRLIGGNLSVFSRLIGTPWMPDLTGAVLLLEDVGERPYRLDRMWTHLQLAGIFEKVRGIVLGDFTACEEKGASYSSNDILRELARETGLPCAAGFGIGHGQVNQPVPLGVQVRLDASAKTLTFLESAVQGSWSAS